MAKVKVIPMRKYAGTQNTINFCDNTQKKFILVSFAHFSLIFLFVKDSLRNFSESIKGMKRD